MNELDSISLESIRQESIRQLPASQRLDVMRIYANWRARSRKTIFKNFLLEKQRKYSRILQKPLKNLGGKYECIKRSH